MCTLWQLVVNTEASGFFEEAGVAAAALGVCCDVYALCPHFVGLELVQPLAGRSGGVVRLYHTLDDAPLPQVNWWWGGIGGGGGGSRTAVKGCCCRAIGWGNCGKPEHVVMVGRRLAMAPAVLCSCRV